MLPAGLWEDTPAHLFEEQHRCVRNDLTWVITLLSGLYQKLAWNAWDQRQSTLGQQQGSGPEASTLDVVLVQVTASIFAGFTSAGLTAPLDLIKTRIQV